MPSPGAEEEISQKKIIEIEIVEASSLKIQGSGNQLAQKRMLPFFTYDFYCFSETSAAVQSQNPVWHSKRQFEIDANAEFLSYMKSNVLKIDFIDESVDITQPGGRDYIGSARVRLDELWQKSKVEGEVPVRDEHNNQQGSVKIKMEVHDAAKFTYDNTFAGSNKIVNSKRI